jgi:hypothetical protein
MTGSPRLWVRGLLGFGRAASAAEQVLTIVRDELLCACLAPARRDELTAWLYARQPGFASGGNSFRHGLQDWERSLLTSPEFPRAGRILLGGAGGGREIVEFAKRGYQVVAFEPSSLVESAVAVGASLPGVVVVRAAYVDLIRAVEAGDGPLATAIAGQFDVIVLGWCSFSHITTDAERIALLRAIRRLAPAAPIVLSFVSDASVSGRGERVRRIVQAALRPVGAQPGSRLRFSPQFGFMHPFSVAEISALAEAVDCGVADAEHASRGHCVFVPQSVGSR